MYERFPPDYDPGERPVDHLVFALKNDGVELGVLVAVFEVIDRRELCQEIASTPNGKYLRRLWFLFEWLTGERLDLPDLHPVGYVDILDPDEYFTARPINVARQRVRDNLLGTRNWCPQVRRTERLRSAAAKPLRERLLSLTQHDADLLHRAIDYAYVKETRSSFALERETPDNDRIARFVELLRRGPRTDRLAKSLLVELQNAVVADAYRESNYRIDQNYIGSTNAQWRDEVHYVCPRPSDVPAMMESLLTLANSWARLSLANDAVVAAAVIAFGFVYIHPFDDGNGRIHRYLIHFMLHRLGFCPADLILPVSAAILRDRAGYDLVLETVSRPLLRHVEYHLDDLGRMTAAGNVARHYAYLDLTPHAEALYAWVEQAIEHDLIEEIDILKKLDDARRRMRVIVDMPDRKRELFIKLCHGNGFKLADSKRRHFAELSDAQLVELQEALAAALRGDSDPPDEDAP